MARYVKAKDIAKEFGNTPRYWTKLAASGKIPNTWQPDGEGSVWLFEYDAFVRWQRTKIVRVKEWQGYTNEVKRGGVAPSVRGKNTDVPLKQEINGLLKNAFARG